MVPRLLLPTLLWLLFSGTCFAQSEVQQATHQTVVASDSTIRSITFRQTPARVGDRVAQKVMASLDLQTSILQANQLARQDTNAMRRQQERFIEVTQVEAGRARRARVHFPKSRIVSPENDQPAAERIQPVEGKSYDVTRRGKNLLVTDPQGRIPPLVEFGLVMNSLRTFGLPSPLTKFLLGREVRLGEKLQVPVNIATQMMGFDQNLGQVQNFEFMLQDIRIIDEQPCAVFVAKIDAMGDPTNPIRMTVQGEVIIQANTCRSVSAELGGPLSMQAVEKTPQGEYQYNATGEMRVAIHSQYGFAAK